MDDNVYEGLNSGAGETGKNSNKPFGGVGSSSGNYFDYNYNDFNESSKTEGASAEHGFLQKFDCVLVVLLGSGVLFVDSFYESGWLSTIIPFFSLLASGGLWLKFFYPYNFISQQIPENTIPYLSLALIALWTFGLVILTTSSDYLYLSTGYAAIWLSFFSSFNLSMYYDSNFAKADEFMTRFWNRHSYFFMIAIFSLIMFVSTLLSCFLSSESGMCGSRGWFAIFASAASFGGSGYLLTSDYTRSTVNLNTAENADQFMKQVSLGFAILWAVVLLFCTTAIPYYKRDQGAVVANVFFPSWICFLISGKLYSENANSAIINQETSANPNQGNFV